jgi:hypothetical protein
MRTRFLAPALAVLAFTAPASAEPPKPTVVVRTQPVSRLLTEYREMIRQVGGPAEGDRAVKRFDNELKDALGEQGFEGLDINRPIAAYSVFREKLEDTGLVLVVPVTGEKEFIAFLDRIQVKAKAVDGKKGVYALELPGPAGDVFRKGSHLRFADGGWAYVGLNDGEPADAKDLVPPGDLFDNAEQSLVSAKLYPGRVPEKLLASLLDEMDKTANGIKGFAGAVGPKHLAKLATTFFEEGPKLVRRYAETGLKEAAEVGLRFDWDQTTGDTVTELTLVPKPGTPLAKEIAAKAATTNRFAGLVPKDAALGVVVKAPLFAPELREIAAALLEAGQGELKADGGLDAAFHPLVDEVAKSLVGAVKKGTFEVGVALLGPNKDKKFTVVGGVTLDDAAAVEKALRQAAKAAELVKLVQFDVEKVGGVGVHKVPFLAVFPEDVRGELAKVFGDSPPGYVAFDKDAVFLAVGPDALAAVKAALAAKPGPAPVVEVVGSTGRLHKLIVAVAGEKDAAMFARILGTDDKTVSMLRVTVEGGQSLKVKATFNLRYLPRLVLAGESANGTFKEVKPAGK